MTVPFRLSVADEPSGQSGSVVRRLHWLLYAIILFGAIVRVHETWVHNPMDLIFSDTERYWDHAKEPLTPSPLAIFDPPVYQTWVSVVQRLTQGIPVLVAIYAAALSVVTPWCWYRFLREAIASRTLALAGWALLSVLPSWLGIYSYFMSETLLLPLLGVSLWMTVRADRKQSVQSFLTMVAFWTVTGLTRGIAIPMAGAAAFLVWLNHPHKIKSAAASMLMVACVLAPLSYRNYYFYRLWAPYGNGWLNKIYVESGAREIHLHFTRDDGAVWFYGFGSPSIDSHPFAPFSDWTSHRTGAVEVNVNFSAGLRDWKAALAASAKHGAERWHLHWENLAFLFFGDSWPDNNADFTMDWLSNQSRWLWAPLFTVLVVAGVWRWRDTLARPLLPVVIATWFFFQAWVLLVPNEGRYRKPAEGLFVAQALVLADQVIARRRKLPIVEVASVEAVAAPAVMPAETDGSCMI